MSNDNKIRVIVCRVGEAPKVEFIEDGLKPMQDIVGGYIERVALDGEPVSGRGVDLWLNEEGLIIGLPPNRLARQIPLYRGDLPLMGNFFIAAHNSMGDTLGLTEDECAEWMERVNDWPLPLIPPQ